MTLQKKALQELKKEMEERWIEKVKFLLRKKMELQETVDELNNEIENIEKSILLYEQKINGKNS